jgi:hypothetical protein
VSFEFNPDAISPQTPVEVAILTSHGRVVREPSHTVEPVTKASDRSDWTPQMREFQKEMDSIGNDITSFVAEGRSIRAEVEGLIVWRRYMGRIRLPRHGVRSSRHMPRTGLRINARDSSN